MSTPPSPCGPQESAYGSPAALVGASAAPVVIRPITRDDVPGFHAALDVVAREQRYLAQLAAPPVARIEGFVHDSVSKDLVQFVAVADGAVVGWADVLPEWAQALAHTGSLGMGLLPGWRGQGLGARLLQACVEKAWAKGLTRIELAARADNTRAIRLYERLGFQHEGTKRRGMCFDGVYFDTVSMALLRADGPVLHGAGNAPCTAAPPGPTTTI